MACSGGCGASECAADGAGSMAGAPRFASRFQNIHVDRGRCLILFLDQLLLLDQQCPVL